MSERSRPFTLRAGPRALRHVLDRGLAPGDIACIPAAAGGPKGLALLPFDRLLLQQGWLPEQRPVELIGASVGAWRMAALAQNNPLAALDRAVGGSVAQRAPDSMKACLLSQLCSPMAKGCLPFAGAASASDVLRNSPAARAIVRPRLLVISSPMGQWVPISPASPAA